MMRGCSRASPGRWPAGINIAGARITTCADGAVLDVFQLQTTSNEPVTDERLLDRVKASIEKAVSEPSGRRPRSREMAEPARTYCATYPCRRV